jgi:hypothetical protein
VLLALAVFLGAFTVIGQIVSTGSQASVAGQLESDAVLRAQTKLAEVVGGIEPVAGVQGESFEDDPDWTWSLTVSDGPHEDLLLLTITVEHLRADGTPNASFVLNRVVRDPQLFIDAAADAASAEEV